MDMAQGQRKSLTAEDWTEAALAAIAEGGLPAVAVEVLAKRLGTTKGSFYWHFADRDALIAAALDLWEQRDTEGVISVVEQEPDGAAGRLRMLLRLALSEVVGQQPAAAGSVELALQANANHPVVAAVLDRVTRRRLAYITALYAELGLSKAVARDRALLAYSAFLGHAQLAHATPGVLPTGRAFRTHVTRVVEALASHDGQN